MSAVVVLNEKVERLLELLDEDIEHLRNCLSYFDELRSLLVKKDEVRLQQLLEKIRVKSLGRGDHHKKLQNVREDLARVTQAGRAAVTLTELEKFLNHEMRLRVREKKIELRDMVLQLKKEHAATSMLILECARFNRMLLQTILGGEQGPSLVYGPSGTAAMEKNSGLFNARV